MTEVPEELAAARRDYEQAEEEHRQARKREFEMQCRLVELEKKHFVCDSPETIAQNVQRYVESMDRPDFPPRISCSHLGLSIPAKGVYVSVLAWRANTTLVTFYGSGPYAPNHKNMHDARVRMTSYYLRADVVDRWNGEEGNSGVSAVYDRAPPESLLYAQKHMGGYSADFKAWVEAGLKED